MMKEKLKKPGYVFLKPGNIATKAWQLLSGFIVVFGQDSKDKEKVSRIYYPGQIVTDLNSFFNKTPLVYKFVGLGEVNVGISKRTVENQITQALKHLRVSYKELSAAGLSMIFITLF